MKNHFEGIQDNLEDKHLNQTDSQLLKSIKLQADLVVAKFGDKYKQWNAAFEAGQSAAQSTPLGTLHSESLDHALKEIDAGELAVCREPQQVVQVLAYVIKGQLS